MLDLYNFNLTVKIFNMKQFLIFGLLVLIQVNFICGYWIPEDLNNNIDEYSDETFEDTNENNDYTQNFQDSLQSWQPLVEYNSDIVADYDDNDNNLQFLQDSNYVPSQQVNIRRRRSTRSIPFNLPEVARQRSKRNSDWFISECTRDECRHRGNGWRALEECGPAFCTCQNGNAYLQGCGQGLIYYAEKRLCTWYYNVPGC